jgi:hypothetical protein
MMKNNRYISFVICIGLISCGEPEVKSLSNSKETKKEKTVDKTPFKSAKKNTITSKVAKVPKTDKVPKSFLMVCQTFYEKVCLKYASPEAILSEDGIYVLDLNSYKNKLQSLNIFTKSFILKQDGIFSDCQKALIADSITPEKAFEGIDVLAPIECSFFHYAYYFQSQDYPDGFYLRNSKIEGENGFTEIHFYSKTNKTYFAWDNQIVLNLKLKKVKDSWVISDVDKIFPNN